MILGTILLALAEIFSTQQGVAIIPEMRVAPGDVVQFSEDMDCDWVAVSTRTTKGESNHQTPLLEGWFYAFSDRLLAHGGSRDDAFKIEKGCLFLFEGDALAFGFYLKPNARASNGPWSPDSNISEVFGQAIALLKSEKADSNIWPGNRITEIRKSTCLLYFVI